MPGQLQGMVILDEVQLKPELFNVLRVLVDWPDGDQTCLIPGSASPHTIKNVPETLAGRVEFIELSGFSLNEVNNTEHVVKRRLSPFISGRLRSRQPGLAGRVYPISFQPCVTSVVR